MTTMNAHSSKRQYMVDTQIIPRGIKDPRVIEAMRKVPRHLFLDEALWPQAYEDHPLPIGEKQTISQPYIVALMTEALRLTGKEKILEIGSGSGYQTAILAELAEQVYTIERIPAIAKRARKIFDQLQYRNIIITIGDGTSGWKEHSPYNGIIVTAASPSRSQAAPRTARNRGPSCDTHRQRIRSGIDGIRKRRWKGIQGRKLWRM